MGFFGFGKKNSEDNASVKWLRVKESEDLDQLIKKESFEKPVLLFKHSTRCSISSMALNRLENYWDIDEETLQPVYIDLIAYRELSNKIAADLGVAHQSPQILLVKNGKCTYQASHNQIDIADIKQNL
ncbi:MAG: bacillithiol system redox-active protein YtxJ [Crocinitomix sp.]|nr:bacillithiol system redox-active protein YtxJ [Crocinitomix sp.]